MSTIPSRIATRVRRDGLRLAARYYVSAVKDGLHYLAYDRHWDRFEAKRTSGAVDVRVDDLLGPVPVDEYRRYHAFPRLPLLWAIKALRIDTSRFTFIDYGSGRGRMLLTAARLPFTKIIGVEFSRSLHDEALQNIVHYPKEKLYSSDIESHRTNAVDFVPPGNFVAFFFNPFAHEIVDRVADQLEAAARRSTLPSFVIFANTKRLRLFVDRPAFRRIAIPALLKPDLQP